MVWKLNAVLISMALFGIVLLRGKKLYQKQKLLNK